VKRRWEVSIEGTGGKDALRELEASGGAEGRE
jgi:hypothetical protein